MISKIKISFFFVIHGKGMSRYMDLN